MALPEYRVVSPLAEIRHPDIESIHVFRSKEEAALATAHDVAGIVRENPGATITYATGNTMEPVYHHLAEMVYRGAVDFSRTTAFHLDEYYPADPRTDPHSFVWYLRRLVWTPLRIGTVHELNGLADNPDEEAVRYGELLHHHTVDLAILGVGPWSDATQTGAHIAFNEPGTPFAYRTHVARLDPSTVYRDRIERGQPTPDLALTQGIADIVAAKTIVLVAYGKDKGLSLAHALHDPISECVPASALRLVGSRVSMYIDEAAASVIAQYSQQPVEAAGEVGPPYAFCELN